MQAGHNNKLAYQEVGEAQKRLPREAVDSLSLAVLMASQDRAIAEPTT